MPVRVLIVDDHAFVRSALQDLLATTGDIRVVATCVDGDEVVSAAACSAPDVVLMDLDMPRMSGLAASRELLLAQPQIRVLVLTGVCSAAAVREAEALGVAGFLLKGEAVDDLPRHIRTVAAGGTAWCDAAAATLPTRQGSP
jgi:DNA-binding NarL/FixJ family response regulator